MRIAYFSDNFYPEISGISDSVITTGEELRKHGHGVVYVSPWYPQAAYTASRDPLRDALPIKRIPSLPFPNSPTGQSRNALPLGASIRFLKRFKPDILHTQSPYGTGLEAVIASKLLGVPLIGTNHTPLEEFLHYLPGGTLIEPLALRYESWYYNRCRFVSAPYQGLIDVMRTRGFKREGRGQANPVPFSASPKSEEQKRVCKVELSIPGPMLLSSGRLAPEKNVDVVLRAFALVLKKIPDATMVITGHGSAEENLRKLAGDLHLGNRVRFSGFVTPEKLEQLYCTAEVYVVMSTAETQSLSLMQGFANGVPAVVARSHGLIDFCPPECGFQVEPGDIVTLADKIQLLLTEPLHQGMGRAGVEFVKKFSPAHMADAWEEIYNRVLRESRG